jgi:hypothetical protein
VPTHGYRHQATLLLTNSLRLLPADASPPLVTEALLQLARDLAALADDTRAPATEVEWSTSAYSAMVDRGAMTFSHRSDGDFPRVFDSAKARGVDILRSLWPDRTSDTTPRDLFVMYLPEDRLPLAAPLAIELTKRRFTVAFSDYEIDSPEEMAACMERGLKIHKAGVLLLTPAVERSHWPVSFRTDRFRLVRPDSLQFLADDLARWLTSLKV